MFLKSTVKIRQDCREEIGNYMNKEVAFRGGFFYIDRNVLEK